MVSAYLNVALDQTIPGLLQEVTPRFNRFSTNQHNLLLRASAFWQQEQRNRNTGKEEHLKTATMENRKIWKQEPWKTGTSENRNIWKQEHSNDDKQEHLERIKILIEYKLKPLEQSKKKIAN